MTDKLTDNEIVKGLEDLIKCNNNVIDCDHCSLSMFFPRCPEQIGELALYLINRKDKEFNRLQAENERLEIECEKQYEIAQATIRAEIADGGTSCHWCEDTIKAEAYKECFALIKNKAFIKHKTLDNEYLFEFSGNDLDNLLKELVGE